MLWLILSTFFLTTISSTKAASDDVVTFDVRFLDGREIIYSFNRSDYGDCIYTSKHQQVTCMVKRKYKSIVDKWKYRPTQLDYLSVNCMEQTYYANNRHACICVNGSDAANPGKYKQHDNLHYCHLTTLPEGMFAKLSQLKLLDLSSNAIRDVQDNTFAGLHSLMYLDLSHNPISSIAVKFLCDMHMLEVLKLNNISMSSKIFHKRILYCSSALNKLKFIDLSDNHIESIPNQLFDGIPNVQTLILRNNWINFISVSAFFGASNLEYLDISKNHLPAIQSSFCKFMYQVKYINISSNRLTHLDMDDMSNCETMTVFDISKNMIRDIKGSLSQRSDLQVFNASGNGIKKVSDKFLLNATHINVMELSFNDLHQISAEVFNSMTELKILKLNGNAFNDTADFLDIFNYTQNLEVLNISSNGISHIVNDTFQLLKSLQTLDLSNNSISKTFSDTFKGMQSLKALYLHHNDIRDINRTSLLPLTSLETIDLSHNMIDNILDNVTMPQALTNVNLEENILSKFPKCFNNTTLKSLNLRSNIIATMKGNRTKDLQSLERLDLSFNQFDSFDNVSFINMTSLSDLNLSFNIISGDLSADVFRGTENLTILNLKKNYISNIEKFFSFHRTKTITHLDLSFNTISQINALMSHESNNQSDHLLRELNLEHGYILNISRDAFLGFLNLRQVNLRNNMLRTIQPFNIAYKTEFLLQNNPLLCNCNMSWLTDSYVTVGEHKVSTFDYEVGTCVVQPENIELPVRKVLKNQFRCKVVNDCDRMCECFSYSSNTSQIDYIDCDGLIGYMPEILSRDARVIYLDGNRIPILKLPEHYSPDFHTTELYLNKSQIGFIEDIFFSGFEQLETLDLSKNKISTLPTAVFNNLLNLKNLYLSDNNIQTVSPLWFNGLSLKILNLNGNKIHHVSQSFLSKIDGMHSLRYVQLQNNPWQCDCENRNFRIWLKTYGKVVRHRYDIDCYGDSKPLLSVHLSEFVCQVEESHAKRRGIITAVIVALICLVVVMSASIYYRRDLIAILYVKLGIGCLRHKYETNRPYDAYLIYDTNDSKCSDWINKSLLTFLEKRRNPYKIVTTDRSKLLSSVANIENAQLQESKSCIFIINNTVMSNSWCVENFHRAWNYARKNPMFKLILIVYGDIELNMLEQEMRVMLSQGQYITARSNSVWDRLIYELPNPETGIHPVRGEDDVSENDVIIYSASSNILDEYGSVSVHKYL
ncbi:slit homolog 1 protein-like [Mytilus californianus]|uniref:slit homolog 1 protein-like n=1 Tax=Mytilus californianus TaxID=6549 RepID=UPI0022453C6F|nr:slit homolog 1 protein-like [Mytilus californianus]XP_052084446.1 slit homolog 1 protein-like [Mytilus californianus]